MMLNLLVFVLISLITLYLATQGVLSSLLALCTAVFSSILAMALLEVAQAPIASFKPDYARGVTFLLLFLLAFSGTRITADMMVPKNIKLPLWVNRVGGGVVGFFVSLVVMGTVVLGIEMLPLGRDLLGFERFASENVMQSDEPGIPSRNRQGIWFSPDGFVQALWNGASGRALGGSKAWSSVHADLSAESYGYRNIVAGGSGRTLQQGLLEVKAASYSDDVAEMVAARKIPSNVEGKRVVTVRVSIAKGDKAPNLSADEDSFYRMSATQARLITDKGKQYYPAGYLGRPASGSNASGMEFKPLPLDSGVLVEDYPRGNEPVLIDLVFFINQNEEAKAIEVKQLARKEVTGLTKGVMEPAVAAAYPPRAYEKGQGGLTVQFDAGTKNIISGKLYLLQAGVIRKDIDSELNRAESLLTEISSNYSANSGGWNGSAVPPGVPDPNTIRAQTRLLPNLKAGDRDSSIQWDQLLAVLMNAQMSPDPQRNLAIAPRYVKDNLLPIWTSSGANGIMLKADREMAADTKLAVIRPIIPGEYFVVATMQTDNGFFMWYWPFKVEPNKPPEQRRLAPGTDSSIGFQVNLEPK